MQYRWAAGGRTRDNWRNLPRNGRSSNPGLLPTTARRPELRGRYAIVQHGRPRAAPACARTRGRPPCSSAPRTLSRHDPTTEGSRWLTPWRACCAWHANDERAHAFRHRQASSSRRCSRAAPSAPAPPHTWPVGPRLALAPRPLDPLPPQAPCCCLLLCFFSTDSRSVRVFFILSEG